MAGISAIEDMLPVSPQRLQPDVLLGLVVAFAPVVASASLGRTDVAPARCPVDGDGVAGGLDEGFDEHGGGAIALGPVLSQDYTLYNRTACVLNSEINLDLPGRPLNTILICPPQTGPC